MKPSLRSVGEFLKIYYYYLHWNYSITCIRQIQHYLCQFQCSCMVTVRVRVRVRIRVRKWVRVRVPAWTLCFISFCTLTHKNCYHGSLSSNCNQFTSSVYNLFWNLKTLQGIHTLAGLSIVAGGAITNALFFVERTSINTDFVVTHWWKQKHNTELHPHSHLLLTTWKEHHWWIQ